MTVAVDGWSGSATLANWTVTIAGQPGGQPVPTRFVYEGDSISDVTLYGTWPAILPTISAFFAEGLSYYFATSGDLASALPGQYPTQGRVAKPPAGGLAYYFLQAGTNDLGTDSAATIYNNLKSGWALSRADGYKVVASTIPRSTALTLSQTQKVLDLNFLILSDPSLYDYVMRPDIWFPDPSDTLYYRDGTHLTDYGNQVRANYVARLILGLDAGLSAPFDAASNSNLIINAGMEVSQVNGTTPVASAGRPVDGMYLLYSGTMVLAAQQVADAPPGFSNSVKVTVPTALASLSSGDTAFLLLVSEGIRTSRLALGTVYARHMSLGFWAKAHRIGSYSGSIKNSANSRSYPFSYAINVADTWEYKTIVGIPGDITGTWIGNTNGLGLSLSFAIAMGSTFVSAANSWAAGNYIGATGTTNGVAATSDTFQLTGVTLLPGIFLPKSGQSPLIMRPYDQELTLCRRYVRKVNILRGIAFSTTQIRASVDHSGMRDVPTPSLAAVASWTDVYSSNPTQSAASVSVNAQTADGGQYDFANFTGLTSGRHYEALAGSSPLILSAIL